MNLLTSLILLWQFIQAFADEDLPCVPRYDGNESVYCVCNSTYCDTFSREEPKPGEFVMYTSSKGGLRFKKDFGVIGDFIDIGEFDMVLQLQPERSYQSIIGFGGALTDSAALNWKSLPPAAGQKLIESYFGKSGIEHTMVRIPVGSSDFSIYHWTYNSYPINDTKLTNFTFSPTDLEFKIPFIKEIFKVATDEIKFVTSTWMAPDWMLDFLGSKKLKSVKKVFYQTYSDYHCKFAELYQTAGVNIWAMSAVNEPLTAIDSTMTKEFGVWRAPDMAELLSQHFGPTIRNCSVKGIKVLALEDQRFTLPVWLNIIEDMFEEESQIDYIDGVALHYYADRTTAPGVIARSMSKYPEKFILVTEACTGTFGKHRHKVLLGSWHRAKRYIRDIIENLNYDIIGWLDWNLCLDRHGGPTWTKNFVDSPIIVDESRGEFYKQPMFYGVGHFAKFLPRGSKRIRSVKLFPTFPPYTDIRDIEAQGQEIFDTVAFETPRGTVVVIVHNEGPLKMVSIQLHDQVISATLEAESIVTIEFVPEGPIDLL